MDAEVDEERDTEGEGVAEAATTGVRLGASVTCRGAASEEFEPLAAAHAAVNACETAESCVAFESVELSAARTTAADESVESASTLATTMLMAARTPPPARRRDAREGGAAGARRRPAAGVRAVVLHVAVFIWSVGATACEPVASTRAVMVDEASAVPDAAAIAARSWHPTSAVTLSIDPPVPRLTVNLTDVCAVHGGQLVVPQTASPRASRHAAEGVAAVEAADG